MDIIDVVAAENGAGVDGWAIPIAVVVVIVVAVVLRWIVHRLINRMTRSFSNNALSRRLARTRHGTEVLPVLERQQARATTAGSLLKSIASFLILATALIIVLGLVGVDVGPIIASAGVIGIAVGFGAQSLIKDFLTGIFMILEDQIGVGDVVDVGHTVGTIENVGLRVTRLRDFDGVVWFVPNGNIQAVGNRTQGWGLATVDAPIAYGEDLDRVGDVLRATANALGDDPAWNEVILDEDPVVAVETMTPMAVTMRVLVKTVSGKNVDVARELRLRVSAALDDAGVRTPAPTAAGQALADEERPGPT